jgi:DNA phosphorothioation-dependent restriction protein DptG
MPKDKKGREFYSASNRLQNLILQASNAVLINQELPLMLYNLKLSEEGLEGARKFLEEFEKGSLVFDKSSIKEDWIKS